MWDHCWLGTMNMTLGIPTDHNHSESFDPNNKGEAKAKTSKGFHHERVQFCFSDELDLPHHVSDTTSADKNQIKRNLAQKDKSYVDDHGICDLSNQGLLQISPRLLPLLATVQMLYLQVSINIIIEKLKLLMESRNQDNQIVELPLNFFHNLPALRYLDLRNNRLSSLPPVHSCQRWGWQNF